jgi:transposase
LCALTSTQRGQKRGLRSDRSVAWRADDKDPRVDERGLPLRLALTAGQAHDVTAAHQLLDQTVTGSVVLGDKIYDADWIVDLVQSQGGLANIPMYADRKRNRRNFDAALYNRLKNLRHIARRHEKTARNFLAMIYIGAARLLAKFESTP